MFKNKDNKMINIIGKIVVLNDYTEVNLYDLRWLLGKMNIKNLVIFSINLTDNIKIEKFMFEGDSDLTYIEVGVEYFIEMMSNNPKYFWEINPNSLYILRDGSHTDIKYILSQIGEFGLNLGRGGSQKSHIMSPLELRLSSYLMAIFNFDYNKLAFSNVFNTLPKSRYLPYIRNEKNQLNDNELTNKSI
uniref:hypothetical protein n=1 Tax=Neopestalotiopsis cubana TaxID=1562163 RepID=UPI00233F59BD|nr:hypothetical protein PQ570_mgp25 [Neopestalotiopsis cubana]WBU13050.1 hypothetical protein [Neopestalotiopsis cubana]